MNNGDEEEASLSVAQDLKNPDKAKALIQRADFSDDALALHFTDRHRGELLYVHLWGRWLRWDGTRWRPENTLVVFDLARALTRELAAQFGQSAKTLRSGKTVAAIVSLARADRDHARLPEDFDRYPMLLNTPGGTVDLRTGQMHPHNKEQRHTKVTPVSPSGSSTLWLDCLKTWTVGDKKLEEFLQRLVGYFLTGLVTEEVLPIFYGGGQNGKTKFIEALRFIMGIEYMSNVAMETLVVTRGEQHPTDVASLRSMRLAVAVETERGRHLAESKIKQLTGGDRLRARFMRQDFFEFDPTHKLAIVGNHKPPITNLDTAIKRRILLIPFSAVIPADRRDKDLSKKLKDEAPGIMAWAIEGCLEWQKRGLDPPDSVRAASAKYFEEQDDFTEWWDACIEVVSQERHTLRTVVWQSWSAWAEAYRCPLRDRSWLIEQIENKDGVVGGKSFGQQVWRGVRVKPATVDPNAPGA